MKNTWEPTKAVKCVIVAGGDLLKPVRGLSIYRQSVRLMPATVVTKCITVYVFVTPFSLMLLEK